MKDFAHYFMWMTSKSYRIHHRASQRLSNTRFIIRFYETLILNTLSDETIFWLVISGPTQSKIINKAIISRIEKIIKGGN